MTTRDKPLLAALILATAGSGLWAQTVPTLFSEAGDPGNLAGQSVASIGDLDGDGSNDVVLGLPHAGLGSAPEDGLVRILSGRVGTQLLEVDGGALVDDNGGKGFSLAAPKGGGLKDIRFGWSVAGLGDVDGDGVLDFAAGAPGTRPSDPGRVGVFSGADGQLLYVIKGQSSGDRFGFALERLDDIDGDGISELFVGAPSDEHPAKKSTGFGAGYADVRSGVDGHLIRRLTADVSAPASRFGHAVAALGDINLDGISELAVGAPEWAPSSFSIGQQAPEGSVFLFDGATGDQLNAYSSHSPYSRFGFALGSGLDVNADGVGDLLVGAPGDLNGFGSVSVYAGRSTAPPASGLDYVVTVEGRDEYGFGAAVCRAGDIDLDGREDFLVGVPEDGGVPMDGAAGAFSHVRLISGAEGESIARIEALDAGWALGTSLAWVGDLLGTGSSGFVIGAPGFGINNGLVMMSYVPGPTNQNGLTGPSNILEGRAGGPTLVRLQLGNNTNGGYEDIAFGPLVVVPKINGDSVAADLLVEEATAFSPFAETLVGETPTEAVTGDFNNDNRDDFATSNAGGNSFSVVPVSPSGSGGGFQGVGSGGFGQVVTIDTGLNTTPRAITAGDMGSLGNPAAFDGFDDIIVSGDVGVACYLNDTQGGFVLSDLEAVPNVTDLVLAQLNPGVDDVPDVIATSGDQSGNGIATVFLGGIDGSLTPAGTFASGSALVSALVTDVDADGDEDVLTVAHFVQAGVPRARIDAWLSNGSGGFVASAWPGVVVSNEEGAVPTYGASADLDGDGLLDAVYTSNDNMALPASFFAGIEPAVEVSTLMNLGADAFGDWQGFELTIQGTAYAGRVVAPILADVFTDPDDPTANDPDLVMVWTIDEAAGQSPVAQPVSFIGLFVGDGEGGFVDPAPNQFATGDEPGDGDSGDVGAPDEDPGVAAAGDGVPDLVFPNLLSNSLTVVMNDGAGGVAEIKTVDDVDELDPKTLPTGLWSGGPRMARLAHLDADELLDVVVYNDWRDEFFGEVRASVSVFRALGGGSFLKTQYVPLDRAGELLLADANEDGMIDVLVTQAEGGNADDTLLVFRGVGDGTVLDTPIVLGVPGGRDLSGGLTEAKTGEGYDRAVFATSIDQVTGIGRVVVYPVRPEGLGDGLVSEMNSKWLHVDGLVAGDLDGDGLTDLGIGTRSGRLVVAGGLGESMFGERAVNQAAAQVGGGALALGMLDGDDVLDIVSSKDVPGGQASVHLLNGLGDGDFGASIIAGLSSTGDQGAQRPLLLDYDGDLTRDVVLSHGTANSISILLSELNDVEVVLPGKPGTAGFTPHLSARGYTTLGSKLVIEGGGGLGGAKAWLVAGYTAQAGAVPSIPTEDLVVVMPLKLEGQPGEAGMGDGLYLEVRLPDEPVYAGFEFVMQLVVLDAGAGADPSPVGLSASSSLRVRLLE